MQLCQALRNTRLQKLSTLFYLQYYRGQGLILNMESGSTTLQFKKYKINLRFIRKIYSDLVKKYTAEKWKKELVHNIMMYLIHCIVIHNICRYSSHLLLTILILAY